MTNAQTVTQRQWPTIKIDRSQLLIAVRMTWHNRSSTAAYLARTAQKHAEDFPLITDQALYSFLAVFGAAVGTAEKPEDCVDAFIELMKKLACPEPGWEGAEIVVT